MDPTELMFQAEWLQTVAERLLQRSWSMDVRLHMAEWLRKDGRNRVARFQVADAAATTPKSVVVKAAVGDDLCRFDPNIDEHRSPAWRFYNEWSATRFLTKLGASPPFCAKPYAGDRTQGMIVFEDLGEHAHLSDYMKGRDPNALETGLAAYVRLLARMQSETIDRRAELRALREAIGGRDFADQLVGAKWLTDNVTRIEAIVKRLNVCVPAAAAGESHEIAAMIDEPGSFMAFSAADMCPDNIIYAVDGSARLFDFEFAGYHHALLDAAYLLVPWPTCACVGRMPDPVCDKLVQMYRNEVAGALPAANDDALFWKHMVACCAYWSLRTVSWTAASALDQDSAWGTAGTRQRNIQCLSRFAAIAVVHRCFPALAEAAWNLAARLRTLWPDTPDMPTLPAFR